MNEFFYGEIQPGFASYLSTGMNSQSARICEYQMDPYMSTYPPHLITVNLF